MYKCLKTIEIGELQSIEYSSGHSSILHIYIEPKVQFLLSL